VFPEPPEPAVLQELDAESEAEDKDADLDADEEPESKAKTDTGADPRVIDRYQQDTGLPNFPRGVTGASGILWPPVGQYYPARGRNWVQVDYLLWWLEDQSLPVLGENSTGNLIAGGNLLDSDHSDGIRIRAGHSFDCDGICGVMFDYFQLGSNGAQQSISGAAANGATLPFTDMDLSLPSNQVNGCACLDGLEGTSSSVPLGSLSVTSTSDLWSGGIAFRGRLSSWFACDREDCCCRRGISRCGYRWDAFTGYRYFSLDETLRLSGQLTPATGSIVATDVFETENDFHGLDLGMIYERERGRWGFEVLGRVALGINRQRLSIDGFGNQAGGIFAQYTNIGTYEHDAFTAIPEVNLTLNYSVTSNLRARFGYSFLLLTNVVRPGTHVDTEVDGRFFDATQPVPLNNPLAFFPRANFETESVWLQGLSFGLEGWF
jgi:hypothetical protein